MLPFIIGAVIGLFQGLVFLARRPGYANYPYQGLIAYAGFGLVIYGGALWVLFWLFGGR